MVSYVIQFLNKNYNTYDNETIYVLDMQVVKRGNGCLIVL